MFHERMEVLLGDGIFNSDGEKWKQQRKTASAEFTMRAMRDLYSVAFTEEALKLSYLLDDIARQGVSVNMQVSCALAADDTQHRHCLSTPMAVERNNSAIKRSHVVEFDSIKSCRSLSSCIVLVSNLIVRISKATNMLV